MSKASKLRDLVIYCDRASDTATELARRLSARRLRNDGSRLRRLDGSLFVNFGCSNLPNFSLGEKTQVLNKPEAVANAISKRRTFSLLQGGVVPSLQFTTEHSIAAQWLQEGSGVLCRRDGLSGGRGITFVPKGSQDLPSADFYTKYFAKTHEFRAHVFRGRLIDLTQKRLQNGRSKDESGSAEERIVRSLENGWIHAHEFTIPGTLRVQIAQVATAAISALGLDFGAVDVLVKVPTAPSSKPAVSVVCEVNSAPGLGNEATLAAYSEAIANHYRDTRDSRLVVRRSRVRKDVLVWITTKKGNRVQRLRSRLVYET